MILQEKNSLNNIQLALAGDGGGGNRHVHPRKGQGKAGDKEEENVEKDESKEFQPEDGNPTEVCGSKWRASRLGIVVLSHGGCVFFSCCFVLG